jgi:glycosyltransferase involved in cell wall biosynthesis
MSGAAKVSVVIPTYNMAPLLKRAMDSVFRQTLADFEIIVVDDASSDHTPDVVRSFADDRVVYVRHDVNRGGSAAVTTGIARAGAPFVAGLDADDAARPRWLEALYAGITRDRSIGMVWGHIAVRKADGTLYTMAFRNPWRSFEPVAPMPVMLTWTPGAGGVMYRKAMLDDVGYYDPAIMLGDRDFGIRLASSRKWMVLVVPGVTVDIYKRPESMSNLLSPAYLSSIERIIEKHSDVWSGHPTAKAFYLYWAARIAFKLGHIDKGSCFLDQAIASDIERRKYRFYRLARRFGLARLWEVASALRAGIGERKRLRRALRKLDIWE